MKKLHFNGVHYYYTDDNGRQLTKGYKTITALKKYGRIYDNIVSESLYKLNAERKRQGYSAITDNASKGLYSFLDN